MTVLVAGSGGMLGADLVATAPAEISVVPLARPALDVTDAAAVAAALDRWQPDVVVNAAAYTAVDRAEADRDAAWAANAEAPGLLGRECAGRGVRLVHFSTDYVFAGDAQRPYEEDDPVAPLNAYGASKLEGERNLAASGAAALVLRTQWLFGAHGRSFPRTMWERASRGLRTSVVDDQFGSPTYTADLARAAWRLIAAGATGTYHVVNDGVATWYDVAARVFAGAGAGGLLARCRTEDYPTPARRPRYSVLATDKVRREHGVALRPWPEALSEFLGGL